MSNLQKLINDEQWLLDLADTAGDFKDIQKAFVDRFGDSSRNKLYEYKRKIAQDVHLIISKRNNLLPEEEMLLLMFKYIKVDGEWILESDLKKIEKNEKQILREAGYIFSDMFDLSKIRADNLFFSKSFFILKYFFDETDVEVIRVDKALVENLNKNFNAGIKNLRSFLSNLERYDFLRKVDTGVFVKRKENESYIAKKMTDILLSVDFNFLTKQKIEILVDSVIRDEELILDEFYYILKDNNLGKFYFSTGNSMYIAKNKKLADQTGDERITELIKKQPTILSSEEMAFRLGLGKTASINFKNIYLSGDYFLFFDKNNESNIKFMHKIFKDFIKSKKGLLFYTVDVRNYLSDYGTEFTKRFSEMFSYSSFLTDLYDEVKYDQASKAYTYKAESNQILDLDDWGDF